MITKRINDFFFYVMACTIFGFTSCNNDYTPKPKAYPKVDFPERSYQVYESPTCPFSFEIPKYARVLNDSTYFGEKLNQPCWLTVDLPPFNGTINLTYKEIGDSLKIGKLIEDAHQMSYKHTRKADYIEEVTISNEFGVRGILFDVGGDAASNVQFYLSDSTRHFIRGALYFENPPNTDSMAPIVSFVKEDLRHFLKTFKWR
jgi:gliding motility-associated lipoprotein GldD